MVDACALRCCRLRIVMGSAVLLAMGLGACQSDPAAMRTGTGVSATSDADGGDATAGDAAASGVPSGTSGSTDATSETAGSSGSDGGSGGTGDSGTSTGATTTSTATTTTGGSEDSTSGSSGDSGSGSTGTGGDTGLAPGDAIACDDPGSPPLTGGAATVHVPADGTLTDAFDMVAEGGVIELAAGTYAAPMGGFVIDHDKSFTVRAAAGAEVRLDGQDASQVLYYNGWNLPESRSVRFESLIFERAYTTAMDESGVRVLRANATFVDCTFRDNVHDAIPGGAGGLYVIAQSDVTCERCTFDNNSALNIGGAMVVQESKLRLVETVVRNNRVNLPGHQGSAGGGAIYGFDSDIDIERSHFESNVAAYSGGGLYVFGSWKDPLGTPSSTVDVVDSTFVANTIAPDPCCAPPGSTGGGAIFVEDQTTLTVRRSRFVDNTAQWGGALHTYRGIIDVADSIFEGNHSIQWSDRANAGGTINLVSSDNAGDTENRRSPELYVRRSYIAGPPGTSTPGSRSGGCIFVAGDAGRMRGTGVPQMGTLADNRSIAVIENTILHHCLGADDAFGPGRGGALSVSLADLQLLDSIIVDAHAVGDNAFGGALFSAEESRVVVRDTIVADTSAGKRGGAIAQTRGELEISGSTFLRNEYSPGVAEELRDSQGAVLGLGSDALSGEVRDNLFMHAIGLPIYERELSTGEANTIVYNNNRFFGLSFGDDVYRTQLTSPPADGLTVAELNAFVADHGGGGSTAKSSAANVALASEPIVSELLAAPGASAASDCCGIEDSSARPAKLAYAIAGHSGTATLATVDLLDNSGVIEIHEPGVRALRFDGTSVATGSIGAQTCP